MQTEDAPRYNLTVATDGIGHRGPFMFLLVSQEDGSTYVGTADGLEETSDVTVEGDRITEADGYTILTPQEVNDAQAALADFTVPTENGAIRQLGISTAFEGTTVLEYDEAADTITDTQTGAVYSVQQDGLKEFFVDEDGTRVSDQSWKANVGFANYKTLFTDPRIRNNFFRIFLWTFVFATLSVVGHVPAGPALRVHPQRPAASRPEDLPGAADHPVRHPGIHLAVALVKLLQQGLRPDQRDHRVERQLVRRCLERQVRRAAHQPVDGLPLHVPGRHRSAAGDPRGPHRGSQDRRRQRFRRLPQDHLPAAARDGGAAAGGDVRLQLQQLRSDLPAHRGRTLQCRTIRTPVAPTS